MPDLSPEARAESARRMEASRIFAANADAIVAGVAELPERHVLVAIIDAEHRFVGTFPVNETELIERVKELEGADGMAMVFSAGADGAHVQDRTMQMALLAKQRMDVIDRINAKQRGAAD
ncbi:MAG TPA: hypothetical protein VK816_11305 [Jatrophihabitantaceae bacterium]|jgi:acetyl-CoA carboxylase beta subunit|nr:hypothetical protein [Jatrophihabitantaceae bacterium]